MTRYLTQAIDEWHGSEPNAPLHPRAAWHFDMAKKYERTALYPWLPVAPDPPVSE
ncbi:MAG: hypothetical protein JWN86_183 [Planctomycetota bacterium]|nr:hypothetical protein [Planctomycetota bacterium]